MPEGLDSLRKQTAEEKALEDAQRFLRHMDPMSAHDRKPIPWDVVVRMLAQYTFEIHRIMQHQESLMAKILQHTLPDPILMKQVAEYGKKKEGE